MGQMTQEQQKAIAIARARLRVQQTQKNPTPAAGVGGAGNYTQGLSPWGVAANQTANVLEGLGVDPSSPIVGTAKNLGGGLLNLIRHPVDSAIGIVSAPATSLMDALKVFNGNEADWETSARGAGTFAGSLPVAAAELQGLSKVADAGAQAGKAGLRAGAETLYRSALKPSPRALNTAETNAIVETGLNEGLPVSYGGNRKLGRLVDDINGQIKPVIDAGAARGDTIPALQVASELKPVFKRYREQVNPLSDLQSIAKTGREFVKTQPDMIPSDAAQAIKKGTYRTLGEKAYDTNQNQAAVAGEKALARGLRKGLSDLYPEIDPLNARESALLDLRPELEAAANRASNYNLFSPRKILDNPWAKSQVARALWRLGR